MKKGKNYQESAKLIDRSVQYDAVDACALVVNTAKAKFDETVEVHIRLGVDSRHADQQVRGSVVLPNGTGKTRKVLVFAKDAKADAAREAGADYVGGMDMVEKIQKENFFDYDVVVATPDMMGIVGRLGKVRYNNQRCQRQQEAFATRVSHPAEEAQWIYVSFVSSYRSGTRTFFLEVTFNA